MRMMPDSLEHMCTTYLTMDHYAAVDRKYGLKENQWFFFARGKAQLGLLMTLSVDSNMVSGVALNFCAERLQQELWAQLGLEWERAPVNGIIAGTELSCHNRELQTDSEPGLRRLLAVAQEVLEAVYRGELVISDDELAASLPNAGLRPEAFDPNLDDAPLTDELQAELESLSELDLSQTEAPRVVRERIGQQRYRKGLEQLWGGRCAVTKVSLPCLLRASHAKPWAECESGAERLSPYNGFLLNVALDALFDQFLISFAADGSIMIAPDLDLGVLAQIGVTPQLHIEGLRPEHEPFLEYHRKRFLERQSTEK